MEKFSIICAEGALVGNERNQSNCKTPDSGCKTTQNWKRTHLCDYTMCLMTISIYYTSLKMRTDILHHRTHRDYIFPINYPLRFHRISGSLSAKLLVTTLTLLAAMAALDHTGPNLQWLPIG
jgi:hypothetical protein